MANPMKNLEQCWTDTWIAFELSPPPNLLLDLLRSYSEPHRFYHTLQHLGECLELLDEVAPLAVRLPEIQLALWFHDAIYDPQRQDNEKLSANWAIESLSTIDSTIAQRVHDLVLVTKHHRVLHDTDAQLLVDVDLAILGAEEGRFAEYDRQIRQEYHWVSEKDFRVGRSQILRSFLERPAIYGTPWLADQLELKARRNLENSLSRKSRWLETWQ
jgi:predicted metal-dependent HD superfamily phosphohydrolase